MMQKNNNRRAAFTLIEILVVIAIIAILAALTSAAVFVVIGTQQRRNTTSTILTLDKLLKSRWEKVINDARNESISAATHPSVFQLANGDPNLAKVIWVKVRLVEAFPEKYDEVNGPASPLSIVGYYIPSGQRKPHFTKYQSVLQGTGGGGAGESAACLLMAAQDPGDGRRRCR